MPLIHFLLVYDRSRQRLVYEHAFTDAAVALKAYEAMEAEHRHETDKEIVLVGENVESVRPSRLSLMPDGQMAGLTPQEAADLLEYLVARK